LSYFSALTLLVWSFDPQKLVPDMTYNVFGGTLNITQLYSLLHCQLTISLKTRCLWEISWPLL